MPNERVSMSKLKQLIGLQASNLSVRALARAVARALGLSVGAVSMRQRHFAGEKLFIDYAGRTVPIYGAHGEEAFQAQLFVSALGASGLAYAEGTRTQALADWLASHVRALEYYGAAPTIFVPDIPK